MKESDLLQSLAERLRREGLIDLKVRAGSQRGADLEGILPSSRRRLFVEVKGIRASGNGRTALGEALLQILCHYDYDVVCAIAVPYTRQFRNLLRSIMPGLSTLRVHCLMVRTADEVWYIPPQRDFSPEKPTSLLERLDQ